MKLNDSFELGRKSSQPHHQTLESNLMFSHQAAMRKSLPCKMTFKHPQSPKAKKENIQELDQSPIDDDLFKDLEERSEGKPDKPDLTPLEFVGESL